MFVFEGAGNAGVGAVACCCGVEVALWACPNSLLASIVVGSTSGGGRVLEAPLGAGAGADVGLE